jgi:hypothetical protein
MKISHDKDLTPANMKGIYGHGASPNDRKEELRLAAEDRLNHELGGNNSGTSDPFFQDTYFNVFENDCEDGVRLLRKKYDWFPKLQSCNLKVIEAGFESCAFW